VIAFIGKLIKKAARAVGKLVKSPIGRIVVPSAGILGAALLARTLTRKSGKDNRKS
jgi:hypothetical protein